MDKRTDDPPLCKCGCGTWVTWDYSQNAWHKYATGHYRRDALYKHEDWLRAAYGSGKSIGQIASERGVARTLISSRLKAFGIDQRAAGEQWRMGHEASDVPRCDLCGSALGYLNTQGVCLRSKVCAQEYQRRYKQRYLAAVGAGERKAYPTKARIPHVYGVHFHSRGLLKVGSSTLLGLPRSSSKGSLRRRGIVATDAELIWAAPGHHLTEIYVQANLSFRLPPAFSSRNRMSEWFEVQGSCAEDLAALLDEIYTAMPPLPRWLIGTETM